MSIDAEAALEMALGQLATKTGLSPDEWRDFLNCTPPQQAAIAKSYCDQSWVQSRDVLGDVLAVLGVLATVAGAVTGVSGAIAAIKAL